MPTNPPYYYGGVTPPQSDSSSRDLTTFDWQSLWESSRPTTDFSAVIEAIAKNPRDRYYKDQIVYLDGYTFTNCCFNNCQLHTESAIFALKSCLVMSNCKVTFGAGALRVIKLFNLRFPNVNAPGPVYNVTNGEHGSITLE